nr:hypothetical protein [Actinomycetota bacterium]
VVGRSEDQGADGSAYHAGERARAVAPPADLQSHGFRAVEKNSGQPAGVTVALVPANLVSALEQAWSELLNGLPTKPTTTPGSPKLYEGTAHAVILTGYERNRQARQECIAHYGASCFLCKPKSSAAYKEPPGEGSIHVHHLSLLSGGDGEPHDVDSIEDLRPVCPNCHALIHARRPPYTMEEMQEVLADKGWSMPPLPYRPVAYPYKQRGSPVAVRHLPKSRACR